MDGGFGRKSKAIDGIGRLQKGSSYSWLAAGLLAFWMDLPVVVWATCNTKLFFDALQSFALGRWIFWLIFSFQKCHLYLGWGSRVGLKAELHHFPWKFLMSKLSFVTFTILNGRAVRCVSWNVFYMSFSLKAKSKTDARYGMWEHSLAPFRIRELIFLKAIWGTKRKLQVGFLLTSCRCIPHACIGKKMRLWRSWWQTRV